MGRPFSEQVSSAEWRRDAEQWISDHLADSGLVLMGEIEQPRVRPWSTQLKVPTDEGLLWFKALCPAARFEPLLQTELARLVPDAVDAPTTIDPERGWMMTRDRGQTLGDLGNTTADDWARVVTETAHIQRLVAPSREVLVAAGLPDCAPHTVPGRFDRIIETFAALPAEHPAHVGADLRSQLEAARPALVDAVATLDELALPSTLQHGDVHPWNVFRVPTAAGDELRLFDFGDAQWAHAAEVLSVPYGIVTSETDFAWEPMHEAYAAEWSIASTELSMAIAAAAFTRPVNRALTWWGCLDAATVEEWREWGIAPLHHLKRILDA